MRLDFKRLLAALLALATLSGASALAWAASTEAEPENSAVAAETTAPDGGEAEADEHLVEDQLIAYKQAEHEREVAALRERGLEPTDEQNSIENIEA